ncbi:hypothetical protein GRF59_15075 [Paenibacillus sp. HJL G12]|uniref:Uncharacterized protein n=1 Tax=Paenibacillus dendrobii TaxID=2691084 RepID=A0A7X3IJ55_9BACL|nr:hypothetical protein [Paenibacillus dendrobii]MWV44943.1 hypothetical protein [Paenibacillus dendrobii]
MKSIEKLVNSISEKLNTYGYGHEVAGDSTTFVIAPTATILTEKCTIEVYKNQIKVNEKSVLDLEEMIDRVIEVEGI